MIFNEIADRGQLQQVLQRRLNMTGAAPAPSLMPEIAPTLTLENDRTEWGFLKGENRASAFVNQTATAGQYSIAEFLNPTNSSALIVLETVQILTATQVNIGWHSVPGSIALSGRTTLTRDSRRQGTTGSIAQVSFGANAVAPVLTGSVLGWQFSLAGQLLPVEFVIAPRTSLIFYTGAVNQTLSLNFAWRERAALPGELG